MTSETDSPGRSPLTEESTLFPYVAQPSIPARAALVFAPHPDDEVLGCGGLIAAWLAAGVPVHVVVVSDGAAAGDLLVREQESLAAAQALAGPGEAPAHLSFWRLPDRRIHADDGLVNRMCQAMVDSGADCILAPSAYEVHPDHRAVSLAVAQAFGIAFGADSPARLAFYEVGHPLFPNALVDITPLLARKQAAIDCFPSQLAVQDYGQQVLALNRFRSYTLGPTVTHAEAFQVLQPGQLQSGLAGVVDADSWRVAGRLGLSHADKSEMHSTPFTESNLNSEKFIQALYQGFLLRDPEPGAVAGWQRALKRGATPDEIAQQFLESAEFKERNSPGTRAFVPPGHFYSPVVDPAAVASLFAEPREVAAVPGVDINVQGQLQTWEQLLPLLAEVPFTRERQSGWRYFFDNPAYGVGDASIYFAMLRLHRPRRIIEIGSGFSSACALDTIERFFDHPVELNFIEPYPRLLESLLKESDRSSTQILRCGVQAVDLDVFRRLQANDILFIDSTHVLKTGSDVHFEFLEILPVLQPGVLIHVHDIFWPFEYPKAWVIDENRSWNELYALRAFLMYNKNFRIEFFNDYFSKAHRALVEQACPSLLENPGGGIWLRKLDGAGNP